jgi:TorA maturation chaperone TorD
MDIEQILVREHQRKTIYHLLAACFAMPQEELFTQLSSLSIPVTSNSSESDRIMTLLNHELDYEALKVDFSRLFVGPFKLLAPPYGSVYLDGQRQIMGKSTLDAHNRYKEAGLEISKMFKDAPDHIAAELEFLYFLIFEQISAIENSDYASALEWLKRQRDFVQNHLGKWVSAFAKNIVEHAETDFYRTLGKAVGQFVPEDLINLKSVIIPELERLESM